MNRLISLPLYIQVVFSLCSFFVFRWHCSSVFSHPHTHRRTKCREFASVVLFFFWILIELLDYILIKMEDLLFPHLQKKVVTLENWKLGHGLLWSRLRLRLLVRPLFYLKRLRNWPKKWNWKPTFMFLESLVITDICSVFDYWLCN